MPAPDSGISVFCCLLLDNKAGSCYGSREFPPGQGQVNRQSPSDRLTFAESLLFFMFCLASLLPVAFALSLSPNLQKQINGTDLICLPEQQAPQTGGSKGERKNNER